MKIKPIPKDFVVCDGMTDSMSIPMELFLVWGLMFGIWIFYKLGLRVKLFIEK